MLHASTLGVGPKVTMVHGFTQTSACWGPIADRLATRFTTVLVDAPGHGGSSDVMAGLRTGARLIADRGGTSAYLGYSMGGRFVLHLALANPELVTALVLVSATAGIDDRGERAAREANDAAVADSIEAGGVGPFLDQWLAQPMFAGVPAAMRFDDEREANTAAGLASSLRMAGTGSQDPSWHKLVRLEMPVLVVAGALDGKFVALGRRMADAIGSNADYVEIADAGHACHLEQPEAFGDTVMTWLSATIG